MSTTQPFVSRRCFSTSLAAVLLAWPWRSASAHAEGTEEEAEVLHTAEAIHQEVVVKASRQRVYALLTEAAQFRKLSNGLDTEINATPGGPFSLFGKAISGRQIELVPGERLVQAWRANGWLAGVFSIARFELKEQGGETRIIFDHTGFPKGQGEHLAGGWKQHYWEPMATYFGS